MKSKIVRYLVSVFFLLLAGNTYSATVEGSFSDWYWLNNQPAINYNFTSVVVTGVEDGAWWAWTPKRIVCAWQCNLMVYANFGWGPGDCFAAPKSWGGIKIGDQGSEFTLAEFNQKLKSVMPFVGTINYRVPPNCKPILWLRLENGNTIRLASTEDGTLPPLDKLPPVDVFCRVEGLSNSEINFGVVNQESKTASISASLICDGNYAGQATARLIFTDANRSGGNTIVLTNPQNKQQIKVKLSVDSPGAGNKRDVTVKVGYKGSVELFASIDEAELKKETSGDFTGSAVIIFNVI